jgi:hypothetical protein
MKIGFRIAGIFVDGLYKEGEGLRVSFEPEEIETLFEVRFRVIVRWTCFRGQSLSANNQ